MLCEWDMYGVSEDIYCVSDIMRCVNGDVCCVSGDVPPSLSWGPWVGGPSIAEKQQELFFKGKDRK